MNTSDNGPRHGTAASQQPTLPRRSRPEPDNLDHTPRPRRPAPAPEPDEPYLDQPGRRARPLPAASDLDEPDFNLPPRRGRPAPTPDANDDDDLVQPRRRRQHLQSQDVEEPDDTQPPRRRRPAPAPAPAPDAAELDQPPQRGQQETEPDTDETVISQQFHSKRPEPAPDADQPPRPERQEPALDPIEDIQSPPRRLDPDNDDLPPRVVREPAGPPAGAASNPSRAAASPSDEVTPVRVAAATAAQAGPGNKNRLSRGGAKCESKEFTALSPDEQQEVRIRLETCKQVIATTMSAGLAFAEALMEIRELRLYRAEGYSDFGKYCREQLNMPKSTVNRQIGEREIYSQLASTGAKILPTSDRQMRPLLSLRQPDQAPEVWGKKVVQVWEKVVHDTGITKEKITEQSVLTARKQLGFDPKPKQEQPPESDLQKRWQKIESVLRHEREFWPVDHQRELSVHIAELLAEWNNSGKKRAPESDSPASEAKKASAPPAPVPAVVIQAQVRDDDSPPRVVAGPMPVKKSVPVSKYTVL